MAKAFKQQLIEAVKAKNPDTASKLTVEDVTFGAVEAYTPTAKSDARNTKIVLTAKEESANFTGNKEFHYIRLASANLIGAKAYQQEGSLDLENDAIVTKLNQEMVAKGYTDDAFAVGELTIEKTDGESGAKVYTVKVSEGHIKFLAGTIATFTYSNPAPEKVALSGLEGELDGFTAPGVGG
ncbi:hypothetical protein DNH98_18020 [Salmonella enterica subsp. enterica serovar Enteritidis]|nr:hypothetical protein [Salmonella enterica subsp. enterica serovar Enteritidis]